MTLQHPAGHSGQTHHHSHHKHNHHGGHRPNVAALNLVSFDGQRPALQLDTRVVQPAEDFGHDGRELRVEERTTADNTAIIVGRRPSHNHAHQHVDGTGFRVGVNIAIGVMGDLKDVVPDVKLRVSKSDLHNPRSYAELRTGVPVAEHVLNAVAKKLIGGHQSTASGKPDPMKIAGQAMDKFGIRF